MNLKYLALCALALPAPIVSAEELSGSAGLAFRQFDAVSSLALDDQALDGTLAAQYGGFGIEVSSSGSSQLTTGILALHYDFADLLPNGNWHYGVVMGQNLGSMESPFVGLEGGYVGENLSTTARATYLTSADIGEGWRGDIDFSYQFHPNWSVYYLYSHYELNDSDFLADDYQTGLRYHLGDATRIEFGYGEVHPKTVSTGTQYIWSQYSVGLYYDFGKGSTYERMRPVFSSVAIY